MNAVVAASPGDPERRHEGATILSVISRAASDQSVDIEKLERLMAMHERMEAKQAETAFAAALSRVQAAMGRVGADKKNSQTGSWYATYGALDKALRPIYTAEGFSLSFGTEPAPEGMVGIVCYVSHGAGHTREYRAHVPSDGKGIKGNSMMTGTHAFGSGASYGMRYLLKLIFNVAIGEDDDDGNAAGATVSDQDASWIRKANQVKNYPAYQSLRETMLKEYGGPDNVPRDVKLAFNQARIETEPKD